MESLPPKPPEEPSGAPPAPEEHPAVSAAAPLPEAVPPPPPSDAAASDPAPADPALADPAPEPAPAARRRPRGRTSLILASAALLGIVAGVATGYTIQADRKPTPLPPLSQAKLSYPDEYVPEDEWEPIPAKHDRRVKTDGDLRKLLVDMPDDAREVEIDRSPDGWVSLTTYAREFERPSGMFGQLVSGNVRRIAGVAWDSGQYRATSIRLVQFRGIEGRTAPTHAEQQQAYMSRDEWAASTGQQIKGSGNGLYWVDEAPRRDPGYLPAYVNRAIAWRGDIMMDIQIYDTTPISEKDIRELAQRQWERL